MAEQIIRHIIIPVYVSKANEVIAIRERIPAHLIKCIGISVSVSKYVDTRESKVNNMANVFVSVNNNDAVACETQLPYNKDISKNISQPLNFSTPLYPGELITGLVIDNNRSIGDDGNGGDEFKPYYFNVILTCLAERRIK